MVANNTMSSSISGAEKSGDLTILKRSGMRNVFFPDSIRVSSLCGMIRLDRCANEKGSNEEASDSDVLVEVIDSPIL